MIRTPDLAPLPVSLPRFEVPFHIICTQCNEMVAKGERFNADKKAIGSYHSTKVGMAACGPHLHPLTLSVT